MIMKNIKKRIGVLLAVLTVAACTNDFEELNTNDNLPLSVTPDLLLAGVIRNTVSDQVDEAYGLGNIVMQQSAKILFLAEDRYNWGERNGIWNNVYDNMRDVNGIISLAESAIPVQNNYLGVALVMKSWLFSLATDAYGDIPYSEAGKAKTDRIFLPKYDAQESIYDGILADLRKANEILGTSSESIAGDLIYGGGSGSVIKWRKLANSLRLRYLMRISDRRDVKAEMQSIVDNPDQNPIFENNEDNAVLEYLEASPNQWPLYTFRVGSFNEVRISKKFSDFLTSINDPRLAVFARPTEKSIAEGSPVIEGVPNALEDSQANSFNGGSEGISRIGLTFACLVCNDVGKAAPVPNAARGLIMTYSELQFILAEARERGLITTGDAAVFYTQGINANFDYYREIVPSEYEIDLTLPAGYFDQPDVVYSGTSGEKLVKIGTQKWIALHFNGLEAWYDWRRTGIPEIIPGPTAANDGRVPVRYIYPLSEQSLNGINRAEAVSRQGADDLNTRVWWDVNPN